MSDSISAERYRAAQTPISASLAPTKESTAMQSPEKADNRVLDSIEGLCTKEGISKDSLKKVSPEEARTKKLEQVASDKAVLSKIKTDMFSHAKFGEEVRALMAKTQNVRNLFTRSFFWETFAKKTQKQIDGFSLEATALKNIEQQQKAVMETLRSSHPGKSEDELSSLAATSMLNEMDQSIATLSEQLERRPIEVIKSELQQVESEEGDLAEKAQKKAILLKELQNHNRASSALDQLHFSKKLLSSGENTLKAIGQRRLKAETNKTTLKNKLMSLHNERQALMRGIVILVEKMEADKNGVPYVGDENIPWECFGNAGPTADNDFANKVDPHASLKDKMKTYKMAPKAGILFAALLGGSPLQFIDTSYYPKHPGAVLGNERDAVKNLEAQQLFSRAALSGVCMQAIAALPKEENSRAEEFCTAVVTELAQSKQLEEAEAFQQIFSNATKEHTLLQQQKEDYLLSDSEEPLSEQEVGLRDMVFNSRGLYRTAEKMTQIVETAEQLRADGKEDEAEKELAQLGDCITLVGLYTPESAMTAGFYDDVCEASGSQKHKGERLRLEGGSEERLEERRETSPLGLMESVCENAILLAHKQNAVDKASIDDKALKFISGSKYGGRCISSLKKMVKQTKGTEKLAQEVEQQDALISPLVAARYKEMDENTFVTLAQEVAFTREKDNFHEGMKSIDGNSQEILEGNNVGEMTQKFAKAFNEGINLGGEKLSLAFSPTRLIHSPELREFRRKEHLSPEDKRLVLNTLKSLYRKTYEQAESSRRVYVEGFCRKQFREALLTGEEYQQATPAERMRIFLPQLERVLGILKQTSVKPLQKLSPEELEKVKKGETTSHTLSPQFQAAAGKVTRFSLSETIKQYQDATATRLAKQLLQKDVIQNYFQLAAKVLATSFKQKIVKPPAVLDTTKPPCDPVFKEVASMSPQQLALHFPRGIQRAAAAG